MFQYGIKLPLKFWGEMFKTPTNLGVLDYKSGYMLAVTVLGQKFPSKSHIII